MIISRFQVNKRDIFFIFFIFAFALIIRMIYLEDYQETQIYPILPYSDSYFYFLWANDIKSGDLLGAKAFMKWPLYAYFLGFLLRLFKNSIFFVYILQFVLGSINCALVYVIAKKIFNRTVAFIAALLCIWYGLFLFYDGLLVYTSLSLLLNSLLFLFILNIQNSLNNKKLFWLGFFLGICTIAQANISIFGILAVIWILAKQRLDWNKLIRNFFTFLIGLSIVIGLVTFRNYLVERDFVLISGNLGFNFYLGNNPEGDGRFYCPSYITSNQYSMFRDARVIAKLTMGKDLKTSEVSRFWFNRSLDFIKTKPGTFLKLLFKKFYYLFSPREFNHDWEYFSIKDKIRIFKILLLDLRFIMPFAFLGVILGLRRFKETVLLYIILFSLSSSIILFFVTARYRISMVPYFMIFASLGMVGIWNALRKGSYIRLGWLCLGLVIASMFSYKDIIKKGNYEYVSADPGNFVYHLKKAIDHEDKLDYVRAMAEAKLAYLLEPNNPHVLNTLGELHYHMDDFKIAEDRFKEAIIRFPFYVDAYYNLGFLYNRQRRFQEAREILEKALSLDPEDVGAHFELGKAYRAIGDVVKARNELNLALSKINRWRTSEKAIIEKELSDLER